MRHLLIFSCSSLHFVSLYLLCKNLKISFSVYDVFSIERWLKLKKIIVHAKQKFIFLYPSCIVTGDGRHRSTYQVVASMQAHISSVRALCVSSSCPDSRPGDIILFSAGGRAQLNAWKIYFQEDSVGCGIEAGNSSTRKESGESACVTEPCFGVIQKPAGCNVSSDSGADTGETKSVMRSTNVMQEDNATCKVRTINRTGENCCLTKETTRPFSIGASQHGGSSEVTGGATCRYKHLAGHMLQRKGRRHRKPWKKATYDSSTETRYMSVCAFSTREVDHELSPRVHVLTAACSDGYIR